MAAKSDMANLDNAYTDQHLRLQLAKDSINTDDIYIGFDPAASSKYVFNQDGPYKPGNGKVSLSSISSDNVALAINRLPLPKLIKTTIRLNVNATADGVYKLNMTEVIAVPQLFEIWLMDAYKKDSLDMRHNATYAFSLYKADTNSFGSNRFSLGIRQNPALGVHLLNFTAIKTPSGAQATWQTENEQNCTNFTVERSTDNGDTFDALGEFSSSAKGTYSFLDKNPIVASDEYRLMLEDLNGTISYSKIVALTYSNLSNSIDNNIVCIYPNPAINIINLSIDQNTIVAPGADVASYAITIPNGNGLIVKTTISSQTLSQENVGNLLPGTYVVQVVNNNDKSVVGESKFVKL
jgi:hypothetical protein